MAPTIRDGQVATKGTRAVNQDRHVIDILDQVYTIDPKSNPMLTVLTAKSMVKPAESFEVKHLEDEPVPEWDAVNDGTDMSDSDTAMVVDNGPYHRVGDVILVPRTGEVVRVTAVSTNTLTVVRGYGGTTAAIILDDDPILNLGAPEEEGDTAPEAKHTITTTKSNFTQIKRTTVHLSRTLSETNMYGPDERSRLRAKAMAEHGRDWEQILLHGTKSEDTSTAATPIRMAGGLDEHITTNSLAAGGALTENEFIDFVGDVMRFKVDGGSGSRALLASREILNTMSTWGGDKLQTRPGSGKYGFAITTYVSPYGDIDIVYHPLLEQGYAGTGYLVDMSGIMIRPLHRTEMKTNIQANDEDGFKDEILTEQSFSFINEKAFGKITGVTFS